MNLKPVGLNKKGSGRCADLEGKFRGRLAQNTEPFYAFKGLFFGRVAILGLIVHHLWWFKQMQIYGKRNRICQ
jgi:hypothetical protein